MSYKMLRLAVFIRTSRSRATRANTHTHTYISFVRISFDHFQHLFRLFPWICPKKSNCRHASRNILFFAQTGRQIDNHQFEWVHFGRFRREELHSKRILWSPNQKVVLNRRCKGKLKEKKKWNRTKNQRNTRNHFSISNCE